MKDTIELRPAVADDEAFLFDLYRAENAARFAPLDMPPRQLEGLLRMQFDAREAQYRAQYSNADFDVVLHNTKPAGNFYAVRSPESFVLVDITLSTDRRGAGIGTRLVEALIDVARAAGKPLLAHVLLDNRAWTLWQRLGFRHISDDGVYRRIEVPAAPPHDT